MTKIGRGGLIIDGAAVLPLPVGCVCLCSWKVVILDLIAGLVDGVVVTGSPERH